MKNKENIIREILSHLKQIVEAHLSVQEQPINLNENTVLTPKEMRTIQVIGKHKQINIKELGECFNTSKSAASQMISKLARKGFAKKENPIDNNRELNLYLTETGQKVFNLQQQLHSLHISNLIQCLTSTFQKDELEKTSKILEQIEGIMKQHMRSLVKK